MPRTPRHGWRQPALDSYIRAERARLSARGLSEETYRDIFDRTATEFLGVDG